jgi:hypothetical protein
MTAQAQTKPDRVWPWIVAAIVPGLFYGPLGLVLALLAAYKDLT